MFLDRIFMPECRKYNKIATCNIYFVTWNICQILSYAIFFRYGKGFGLLHYIVGEEDWLNQPNSVFGIIFYVLHLFLSKIFSQIVSVVFWWWLTLFPMFFAYQYYRCRLLL